MNNHTVEFVEYQLHTWNSNPGGGWVFMRKCSKEQAESLIEKGTDYLVLKKTTTHKEEVLNPRVDLGKHQSFE